MPTTNGHGPKTAILYARVSTDEQASNCYSMRQQIERLRGPGGSDRRWIQWGKPRVARHGPCAGSGERLRRIRGPGARHRDRFAREPAYVYLLREEFADHGCKLRSLNDRGDDSPEGELTDGILDQLAKFERAKMMERIRRGKQCKAREGTISTNRAAFGFDYNATRDGFVINPDQMEVIRRIFYMAGVEKTTIYAISG